MSYQVALSFEDGVTKFIKVEEGQTVADASYRQRINIPLDCRDGACGTCKAFCEAGEFDPGFYIDDALTEDEAEQGYCLACQMKPKSDLVLQIASTSAVAKTQSVTYKGTLTKLDRLSPTTFKLTVEIPNRDKLAFLPGQYVNIAVPGTEETRSYSFSNGPHEDELEFLIKLSPGGVMTEYLEERAKEGDEISFTGPNGSFFLREGKTPLLLLAGGTGLAPILAILRRLEEEGSTRPVHLIYGATTDDDVVQVDVIEQLAEKIPSMTWDYCVADEKSTAKNIGYVMTIITEEHMHSGETVVYLCGPPPMVEGVRNHFKDEGIEPAGFFYEKFALSGTAAGGEKAKDVPAPEPEKTPAETQTEGEEVEEVKDGVAVVQPDLDLDAAAASVEARPIEKAVSILGQSVFVDIGELSPLGAGSKPNGAVTVPDADTAIRLSGQPVGFRIEGAGDHVGAGGALQLHDDGGSLSGQTMQVSTGDIEPLVAPRPKAAEEEQPGTDKVIGTGGYVIGEEHPDVTRSDAIFDAREALELGAVELMLGRISSQQLAGYRLLADATLPYVEGDRFVDAPKFVETNAAFHEYLFALTGNEHLAQAYTALGVKGHMADVLEHATWCDPEVAPDHVRMVEAFERGDRDEVRTLFIEHAERSKRTMRRAMQDNATRSLPAFVTPGRFDHKVVLITGAAQGIGERTARRICAEGGTVVLADRSDLVEALADELESTARDTAAVVGDLETYEGARAAVKTAVDRFGRLDVVIHTVGGTIWAKPFHEYPEDQITKEINRSLFPTLWGCRAAAEQMVKQGRGTIVNVSSVATRGVNRVPYAAAKGGVNAITASLALELAPYGIRVVATAPGGTDAPARRIPRGPGPDTDQEKEWYQAIVDQTVDSSLLKRYGTLDEQAAALCFIASDEASYITGTVLPVAGGDLG